MGKVKSQTRRPVHYWSKFNDWWREVLEKQGRRPEAAAINQWYAHHSQATWAAEEMPTVLETRIHAKCLRSVDEVRNYFRQYRAAKRADAVARDGMPCDGNDDEEDAYIGPQRVGGRKGSATGKASGGALRAGAHKGGVSKVMEMRPVRSARMGSMAAEEPYLDCVLPSNPGANFSWLHPPQQQQQQQQRQHGRQTSAGSGAVAGSSMGNALYNSANTQPNSPARLEPGAVDGKEGHPDMGADTQSQGSLGAPPSSVGTASLDELLGIQDDQDDALYVGCEAAASAAEGVQPLHQGHGHGRARPHPGGVPAAADGDLRLMLGDSDMGYPAEATVHVELRLLQSGKQQQQQGASAAAVAGGGSQNSTIWSPLLAARPPPTQIAQQQLTAHHLQHAGPMYGGWPHGWGLSGWPAPGLADRASVKPTECGPSASVHDDEAWRGRAGLALPGNQQLHVKLEPGGGVSPLPAIKPEPMESIAPSLWMSEQCEGDIAASGASKAPVHMPPPQPPHNTPTWFGPQPQHGAVINADMLKRLAQLQHSQHLPQQQHGHRGVLPLQQHLPPLPPLPPFPPRQLPLSIRQQEPLASGPTAAFMASYAGASTSATGWARPPLPPSTQPSRTRSLSAASSSSPFWQAAPLAAPMLPPHQLHLPQLSVRQPQGAVGAVPLSNQQAVGFWQGGAAEAIGTCSSLVPGSADTQVLAQLLQGADGGTGQARSPRVRRHSQPGPCDTPTRLAQLHKQFGGAVPDNLHPHAGSWQEMRVQQPSGPTCGPAGGAGRTSLAGARSVEGAAAEAGREEGARVLHGTALAAASRPVLTRTLSAPACEGATPGAASAGVNLFYDGSGPSPHQLGFTPHHDAMGRYACFGAGALEAMGELSPAGCWGDRALADLEGDSEWLRSFLTAEPC